MFDEATILLAKALEGSIFQCLLNTQSEPDREEHWLRHAARLESKFTNQVGCHYSLVLYPENRVKSTT